MMNAEHAGFTEARIGQIRPTPIRGTWIRPILVATAACLLYSGSTLARAASGSSTDQTVNDQPIKALVHGTISSETYEDLSLHLAITADDGQQDASQFDVLIFDGNSEPADGTDAVLSTEISRALGHGKWVLAFDAGEKVKTTYIAPVIYFSTPGRSRSYLVRSVTETDGSSSWRIISSPAIFPGGPTLNPEKEVAWNDAESLVTRLKDPGASLAPVANPAQGTDVQPGADSADPLPPDSPIPPGLIHSRWYSTVDEGPLALPQPAKRSNAAKQHYRLIVNSTYTAFLNNNNNASGDFQFVLVQIDGSFNPTNGTGYFANMTTQERAWFDDRIRVRLDPSEASDPKLNLSWVNNAPITPNPTSTYTTNSSFTIGFFAGFGESSYTWGTSKSFEIPAWKVSSNGSGSNMDWNFRSANPNADIAYNQCASNSILNWFNTCGVFDNGYPNSNGSPNELSRVQNIFHTAVVYRTVGVRSGTYARALFVGRITPNLPDLFCNIDIGAICGSKPSWDTYFNTTGFNVIIDLNAVVPVPLQHMTFSQNPAVAGTKVTGQVFLQNPAPIDTRVFLTSLNPNRAKVPASIVIAKGQTSNTFDVLTTPGGSSGVDTIFIDANYAGTSLSEPFMITTYAAGALMPPTTVVTTNPSYWTEHLPIGKWVFGFMVRYAVSYVDAQGHETSRGPWAPWFTNSDYALPILFNVPIDASHRAVKRRIYRQFYADVDNANPEAGIERVGELEDNTTTQFRDQSAN